MFILQILTLLGFLAFSAFLGVASIEKFIQVQEAKHELKQGSAGFIRGVSGGTFILLWIFLTWFCAGIIGDWWVSGDFDGAMDRAPGRLISVVNIVLAMVDG